LNDFLSTNYLKIPISLRKHFVKWDFHFNFEATVFLLHTQLSFSFEIRLIVLKRKWTFVLFCELAWFVRKSRFCLSWGEWEPQFIVKTCDNSHTRKPMKELVLKGKRKKMNCLILRFLLFLWLTQKFKVGGFSTFVDITLEKTFSLSEYFGTFDIPVEWWFRLSFDDAFDPPCPPKNQYWIRLFMMKRAQRKFQKGKKRFWLRLFD